MEKSYSHLKTEERATLMLMMREGGSNGSIFQETKLKTTRLIRLKLSMASTQTPEIQPSF